MDAGERGAGGDVRGLALAFTAGLLWVHTQAQLPGLPLLTALALSALIPWSARVYWAAAVLAVLLGSWHAQGQLDMRWPESRHDEELWLRGAIVSLPEHDLLHDARGAAQSVWRFSFAPGPQSGLPQKIRVSWYRGPAQLAAGSCWRLRLRLRAPHGSLNPGGFDYEAWLYRQHLGATASVRDAESCGEAPGWYWLKWRQAWLDRIDASLAPRLGKALLKALTLGATGELRDADWEVLRLTGTTHLVAISGFNLALVSGLAWWLLRWLWPLSTRAAQWLPAQRFAGGAAVLLALGYAALAGFEAPIARALFMLLLAQIAGALGRPAAPSRILALAWLAVLLPDPCAVLMPGLWLSFAAVAAIFYLSSARLGLGPGWRLALRLQIFLSVVLAPLGLYYFHGLSGSAALINLLTVPLFALLTPLALLGVLAAVLWAPLGAVLLPPLVWLLEQVFAGLSLLAGWSSALWWPAAPGGVALLLATLGALLLFAPMVPLRPLGLLCLLPMLVPATQAPRGDLDLQVLDVGQGLAVLVRTRTHSLLFDAGPAHAEGFDAGASVVAPALLSQGVRELDLLLLSHGDNDHAGGVPAVRRLLRVRRELGTDGAPPCRDGQGWVWDGVRFALLHPASPSRKRNDNSCVLKIEGSFQVLLPGDIEKAAEAELIERHGAALRSDLLLAPHHGSRSSSTPDFVAAVAPQLVVFPAGWHNRFAHPRAAPLHRYACDAGARLWLSGESGALRIWREAGGAVQVEGWRARARRFWNAVPDSAPYWRRSLDCSRPED